MHGRRVVMGEPDLHAASQRRAEVAVHGVQHGAIAGQVDEDRGAVAEAGGQVAVPDHFVVGAGGPDEVHVAR